MSSSPANPRAEAATRGVALFVTTTTKVAGVVVGVNELVLRTETTTARIALAALMMSGAQVSEGVLLRIIERMFGGGGK